MNQRLSGSQINTNATLNADNGLAQSVRWLIPVSEEEESGVRNSIPRCWV